MLLVISMVLAVALLMAVIPSWSNTLPYSSSDMQTLLRDRPTLPHTCQLVRSRGSWGTRFAFIPLSCFRLLLVVFSSSSLSVPNYYCLNVSFFKFVVDYCWLYSLSSLSVQDYYCVNSLIFLICCRLLLALFPLSSCQFFSLSSWPFHSLSLDVLLLSMKSFILEGNIEKLQISEKTIISKSSCKIHVHILIACLHLLHIFFLNTVFLNFDHVLLW